MNSFALCELCHDNGPFYCCFAACHTCGDTTNYCLECWDKWISMCQEQGRLHANCPHCRTNLYDTVVQDLIGRPYKPCKLRPILEEETFMETRHDAYDIATTDTTTNTTGNVPWQLCCCQNSTTCPCSQHVRSSSSSQPTTRNVLQNIGNHPTRQQLSTDTLDTPSVERGRLVSFSLVVNRQNKEKKKNASRSSLVTKLKRRVRVRGHSHCNNNGTQAPTVKPPLVLATKET